MDLCFKSCPQSKCVSHLAGRLCLSTDPFRAMRHFVVSVCASMTCVQPRTRWPRVRQRPWMWQHAPLLRQIGQNGLREVLLFSFVLTLTHLRHMCSDESQNFPSGGGSPGLHCRVSRKRNYAQPDTYPIGSRGGGLRSGSARNVQWRKALQLLASFEPRRGHTCGSCRTICPARRKPRFRKEAVQLMTLISRLDEKHDHTRAF